MYEIKKVIDHQSEFNPMTCTFVIQQGPMKRTIGYKEFFSRREKQNLTETKYKLININYNLFYFVFCEKWNNYYILSKLTVASSSKNFEDFNEESKLNCIIFPHVNPANGQTCLGNFAYNVNKNNLINFIIDRFWNNINIYYIDSCGFAIGRKSILDNTQKPLNIMLKKGNILPTYVVPTLSLKKLCGQ